MGYFACVSADHTFGCLVSVLGGMGVVLWWGVCGTALGDTHTSFIILAYAVFSILIGIVYPLFVIHIHYTFQTSLGINYFNQWFLQAHFVLYTERLQNICVLQAVMERICIMRKRNSIKSLVYTEVIRSRIFWLIKFHRFSDCSPGLDLDLWKYDLDLWLHNPGGGYWL